jgi:hypothetical protein
MKKGNLTTLLRVGSCALFLASISAVNAQGIGNAVNVQSGQSQVISEEEEGGEADRGTATCGGVERWTVKVCDASDTNQINWTPVLKTVSQMVALTTPTPYTTMPRTGPIETTTYVTNCTITIKKAETDNDYHLVLYDGSKTMIGEIPDPACTGAASSSRVKQFIAARNFIDAHIASGNVFSVNIPPVVVTGVGFVDPPHGQTGAAANNMEIHPIIDIHFQTATSILDIPTLLTVNVGPNPFSTSTEFKLNTKLNNFTNVSLSLFDMLGQEVRTVLVPLASNSTINYTLAKEDLKAGVYFYRFRNEGSILYEGRIVVQ